jgi:hypothetical protein
MAMKETERSLRWYFLIAGGLSVVQALPTMSDLSKLPGGAPVMLLAPLWYGAISHLVLGALFFMAGLRLKQALRTGARWIQHLILIAGAALILEVLWVIAVFGARAAYEADAVAGGFVGFGIRLAVVAYLYASVRRLSTEAQVRAAATSFE